MNTNIYALILAGGIGTRMGNVEKPKQFLTIGEKPIIIHTIEKFIVNSRFERIIVLVPAQWINYTKDIINKYIAGNSTIDIIAGGSARNDTIMNGINHIEQNYKLDPETVIVTHDSVRPFVTHRIIEENIDRAIEYGATDTVVPSTDTIVVSDGASFVSEIPDRKLMYQGQTPQAFKAYDLRECYGLLSDAEKVSLSDACKIMTVNHKQVYLVRGDETNIKITHPHDLKVAEAIIGGNSCAK